MTGRELVELLEGHGFAIVRRSRSFVWVGRGKAVLLVDVDADITSELANEILDRARRDAPE